MAFNPFDVFRKRRKTFLAIAAILCMFVFILQFGRGDAIERLLSLFGASLSHGKTVATLHGTAVSEADLEKLSRQRVFADEFMTRFAGQGVSISFESLNQRFGFGAADKTGDDSLSEDFRKEIKNVFFRLLVTRGLDGLDEATRLRNMAESNSPGEAIADSLIQIIAFNRWTVTNGRERSGSRRESFFGGGTNDNDELLDFLLWKREADRLGVNLTETDVRRLANRDAAAPDGILVDGKYLKLWGDGESIRNMAARMQLSTERLTDADLLEALKQEYRVVLAREAAFGSVPNGVRAFRDPPDPRLQPGSSALATPFDFYQYYLDNRSTLAVELLPVPVEKFLKQAMEKGAKPTSDELRALFDKYKNQEPSPERETPGFKEPRQMKVEYVTAKADDPFYVEAAKARVVLPTVQKVLAGFNLDAGGGVPGAVGPLAPILLNEPLVKAYRSYRDRTPSWVEVIFSSDHLHDGSIQRAHNVATMVGNLTGEIAVGGTLFGVPGAFLGSASHHEGEDRLRAMTAAVLANFQLGGVQPSPFPILGAIYPAIPEPLPLESVIARLIDEQVKEAAPEILRANVRAFLEEMAKKKKDGKPEETRAYIEKAIKDYGFQRHVMAEPKTQYEVGDDPALKALRDAYKKAWADEPQAPELYRILIEGKGTYDVLRWTPSDREFRIGDAAEWAGRVREPFLFWRVEDQAGKTRTFDQAKADVEKAFYMQEARRLARKEAEAIAKSVGEASAKWPSNFEDFRREATNFLNETKVGTKAVELDGVARLVPRDSALPGARGYQEYRPPEDKVRYPRASFVDQLMKLTKPGEAVVVRDKPETTYYVATLLTRKPTADKSDLERWKKDQAEATKDFKRVYENAMSGQPDTLWQRMMGERTRDYREAYLKRLRKEATNGNVDAETGKIKLPEGFRNRATPDDVE